MTQYSGAVDQGTTSTRFMVFDHGGNVVGVDQKEHEQIYPKPGWVEHDPTEIWDRTQEVIEAGLAKAGIAASDLAAVGVTNQRETTVVWDSNTGEAVYNAIVWQDTRTDRSGRRARRRWRARTGSGRRSACRWPPTSPGRRSAGSSTTSRVPGNGPRPVTWLFGNMDTWVIWNLTGGTDGGVHVTDVTNASRTMLMDLGTLDWDDEILGDHGRAAVDAARDQVLVRGLRRRPRRSRSAASRSPATSATSRRPRSARPASTPGMAKNTYGTGNFMLLNTGTEAVQSKNGLLTTLCYKIGDSDAVYALEGSIAITGALVQWLRDNLGLIENCRRGRGAGQDGRGQRRRCTSCRPSRACSPRTGSRTPAA